MLAGDPHIRFLKHLNMIASPSFAPDGGDDGTYRSPMLGAPGSLASDPCSPATPAQSIRERFRAEHFTSAVLEAIRMHIHTRGLSAYIREPCM